MLVVGAHAKRDGPGHVQERFAEDGLPARVVVTARHVFGTRQPLATVRRDRRDALGRRTPTNAGALPLSTALHLQIALCNHVISLLITWFNYDILLGELHQPINVSCLYRVFHCSVR